MNRSIKDAINCPKCGAVYDRQRMVYHPPGHYAADPEEHIELTCDRCTYREWFRPLDFSSVEAHFNKEN